MSAVNWACDPLTTRIEQAIARGEDPERICASLDVDMKLVDAALRRMDRAISETDRPNTRQPSTHARPGHGTEQGWRRHRENGQNPCYPCRDAHRAKLRARWADRMDERVAMVRKLAGEGFCDWEIGRALSISVRTVWDTRRRHQIVAAHPKQRKSSA